MVEEEREGCRGRGMGQCTIKVKRNGAITQSTLVSTDYPHTVPFLMVKQIAKKGGGGSLLEFRLVLVLGSPAG